MEAAFWDIMQSSLKLVHQNNKIQNRQLANKKLVNVLSKLVEKYPELRFGQILIAYGFVKDDTDLFFEESIDTLKNIRDDNSK